MKSGFSRERKGAYRLSSIAYVLATLAPFSIAAQIGVGTLSGTITAASGSSIPNARLSIKNIANGETVSATANTKGSYTVSNLVPGTYEVLVYASGFAAARAKVTITAEAEQVTNFVLQAGETAEAGNEQASSSTVSGEVNSQRARELPLNGRSTSDVVTLEPGVASARTQASGQGQYGFGTQITISGSRPRQNDSRLDGISVNDYANGPPASALGVSLGVDSIERVTVLTSNYPAQVGRSSGGVVGASTRSGTKAFHGDVFEFIRNSAFDARNFFDTTKPPFRRNQFGASAGGPLWKDKTFIFGDYEGLRQSLGVTQVDTVPSSVARAGELCSIPQGPPNPCTTFHLPVGPNTDQNGVDLSVKKFLPFWPLPNGPLLGAGDTGIFTFSGQEVTPENYFTSRVDHKLSGADTLSGTYMFDSGSVQQPDEMNNKRTGYNSRRQLLALSEAHTFSPQFLNSFRFGINRVVANTGLTFSVGNALASDSTLGAVPEHDAPIIIVSGLTKFTGGLGAPSTFHFHWTTLQAYDDVSWTRGKHSLKFGAGVERMCDNMLGISNPNGEFSFNSLIDLLTNAPFSLAATIPSTISERGIRQTILGAYIQDDWRWRRNLMINLGLRYEIATVPTEVQGKLTVLRHLTDATPHIGDPLFSNPTLRNFEPRVGFSWDPLGDGKAAVSGGFGIFDVLPLPYLIQLNELFSAPFYESGNVTDLPAGSFPSGAFAIVAGSPTTFRQAYFDPDPHRNYVMQWNLTVQRQLATDLSLRASYVGSHGLHQPFRIEDSDIALPTLTPQGYLWPSPVGSGTRLNLDAGRITAGLWDGRSYYNGLQVQIKQKFRHRAQLAGSYTWGKSIDTSSGSIVGDEHANSISSPLFFDPKLNRGLSDFNIAHNLEVNYNWELGSPEWNSRFGSWAFGGWELGGVFEASTGVPFTPGFGGDALGVKSTDPSIDVPHVIAGPGCSSLVSSGDPVHYIKTECFAVPNPITLRGNLGRNTLIGPGLMNFDFSLFKNNHIKRISDAFNVQFRAEFFNVFNRANFAPPLDNRNIFDSAGSPVANAGLITSTQTPSRQIQFALKIIW